MLKPFIFLNLVSFFKDKNANIMVAIDLVQVYTRTANSRRCMVKIDTGNDYDSIDWSDLTKLGFPIFLQAPNQTSKFVLR